jgi:hypothetical protein
MATTTVAHPAPPTTTNLNARAERALALYREHGDEIRDLGGGNFAVPSCMGREIYRGHYGAEVETCECPDFRFGHTCKHLLSVGIMHARRRSGVKEISLLAVGSGDPFKAAAGTTRCVGCRERFPRRKLVTVREGRHDGLVFFDGDKVCRPCARRNRVSY